VVSVIDDQWPEVRAGLERRLAVVGGHGGGDDHLPAGPRQHT